MSAGPCRFEVAGALPDRSLALEASAGTGKTWTLASLAVRYLAERDVTLPEVLMVTFTRAATAELRERVRVRIAEAIREAARALGDPTWRSSDPVLDRIVGDALRAGVPELQVRLARLEAAAQQLDDATISTIHGFCQRMLQHAALEAGVDFDAVLLEDDYQLVTELVDDHLARALRHAEVDWARYLRQVGGIGRDRLATLARVVTRLPALHLLPDHPADGDPLDSWHQALEQFRCTWQAGGREEVVDLVGRLAAEGAFASPRQRTFTAAVAAARADDVDAWLALRHRVPPGRLDTKKAVHHQPGYPMAYFTAAALASKLAADVVPPEHPVLTDAERLLAQVTVPATLFLQQAARYLWDELDRRKRQRTVLTFDDLLGRLADALEDHGSRDAVRAAIRQRYRVALIDEFQDTDAVQWRIFSSLFDTDEPFVLIGDPKQAIYAFRGADIHTYLRARDSRSEQRTLEVNYRSDASYVAACNTLFGAAGAFASPEIGYRPIDAHQRDRLHDPAGGAALQVRYVHRDAAPRATGGTNLLNKGWIDRHLPGDVAHEVVGLLDGGLELEVAAPDGLQRRRRLAPRDLAVLVRTNRRADAVQRALRAAGVPAVIQRGGSVFATAEAEALQRFLDAMLRPGNDRLASAAAASILFGRDAATLLALRGDLADGPEAPAHRAQRWDDWIEALTRWGERWQRDGVLAAVRQAFAEDGVDERLLAGPTGDRHLTNVRHLVELLHTAESGDDVHPAGLVEWLRGRRADAADGELPTVESELRLEEDAEAVRVVTVHGSKGLQYPVVLCPDLWDGRILLDEAVTRFHDPDARDPRHAVVLDVDVDRSSPGKRRSIGLAREAEVREQLRLAYVALTRAEHRCIVWWGPLRDAPTSALASLLHGTSGSSNGQWSGEAVDDPSLRLQRAADRLDADDELLIGDLEELGRRAVGSIGVRVLTTLRSGARWEPPAACAAGLEARRFTRGIELRWRRTSFTALAHEVGRLADPGPVGDDGRDVDADTVPDAPPADDPLAAGGPTTGEVPLARFPRGAGPGTFLHDVMEHLDFHAVDAALPVLLAALEPRHGIPAGSRPAVVTGLRAALTTPLGPAAGGCRLADLARTDRLDELRFELPLGIGGRGSGFSWSVLAETAERSGDELLEAYARRLRDPASSAAPPPIRGYLTGSIDLLARLPDGRFLVADYKSNWLGDPATGRSTVEDYRPASLAATMVDHHYVLQGLLYLVATHRYLRWRLPGYRYETHVAGAAYLFLRGMVGPATPTSGGEPHGVAMLRPAGVVIEELSARFDEVRA